MPNTNQDKDYKQSLDALYEWTAKNWWKTGNCTKENATTGSIQLEPDANQEQVRGQ